MPKTIFSVLLLSFMFISGHAQISPAKNDRWKGFERVNFKLGKHTAYYVKPAKAVEGNPWIWRGSFPDWHTEMDSLLLTRGFHVAYVSIDDQYGSPYAMQVWDQWYNYLTDSVDLARKMTLEGVSRGGLYVFGWAKRNPDKVNCIYGEGPVCDFKSWPGGKLKGKGDPKSWQQLLEVYGMTEAEAMAYKDNPIDNLEGLASYKVPVIHAVGLKDEYVPAEENSNVFAERYAALGGPVMIYPMTRGTQTLAGHHYPIEAIQLWVDFIMSVSVPVQKIQDYSTWFTLRNGMNNSVNLIKEKKAMTVAFLGGSITHNKGWRDKVGNYLKERYPDTKFSLIAAGIPSLGSLPHAFRLQKDVLDKGKVDLLFVEAAVNDRANSTDSLTQLLSLEGIVRHARKNNPAVDIVFMSFADPDKNKDYAEGRIPAEISNHEKIAGLYGLPSINLAKAVYDKIQNKEFSWEFDFKDLHPSVFGQELYFAAIKELLTVAFENPVSKPSVMPEALLKNNFENGRHVSIQNARPDAKWTLNPDWTPSDKLSTRPGFVHVPMLTAETPGASLSLDFEGAAIGINIVSGADAGVISYAIDKGKFKELDLYTQWSNQLHLPWFLMLDGNLKKGKHTLHLKISDKKNEKSTGNACRIVTFLVN
jgi:sialidase-1